MGYDIIVLGGGIAGSAIAIAASRAGRRILVVESERAFRDRIRGEGLHPWGVREARRLGLAELLQKACARALPSWDTYVGGRQVERRDLPSTTMAACESMAFFHPEMQKVLLDAAERAGASVLRGARAQQLEPGLSPRVEIVTEVGETKIESAPLVVVATGRTGGIRTSLGLTTGRGDAGCRISGLLLDDVDIPVDAVAMFFAPTFGKVAPVFPLSGRRARLYLVGNPRLCDASFAGDADVGRFLESCSALGVPHEWIGHARAAGPLATFDGTSMWSEGTWPPGIALVGDAAGSLDPAFGAGLSLALLDVRTLAEELEDGDLTAAARRYQRKRALHYHRLLQLESWTGRVLYGSVGRDEPPRPDLLPKLRELGLDVVGGGPDCPMDESTEKRLFFA